jgi:hypothetical protein
MHNQKKNMLRGKQKLFIIISLKCVKLHHFAFENFTKNRLALSMKILIPFKSIIPPNYV